MPTSTRTMAHAVRFLAIDAVNKANSGHPGMPMGMADITAVLFRDFLKFNPADPAWPNRDRFVVSNGHGSMLLYSVLHLTGYNVSIDDLKNFRQLGSNTPGHPELGHTPGVETTTGPLGQGVANAVGMAIAQKKQAARYGSLMHHKIYVTVGDGCLMEGISHEACEMAGHLKLDNLILLFDDNSICIDGDVAATSATDVTARFESYGFSVISADGHDETAIHAALTEAQSSDKPVLIRCKTQIGYGSTAVAGTAKAHGAPLGDSERAAVADKLGWPHAPFDIPEDVYAPWRRCASRGKAAYQAWQQQAKTVNFTEKTWPQALEDQLLALKKHAAEAGDTLATRKASGQVFEILQQHPLLISGSADLTGSVNTRGGGMTTLDADNPNGSFIHYGVREHAMAAVMNGLALSGFIPTAGTFLAFSDYMKPALRMSALMNQQVIYVLTHDSIGLGEDGPTHQPVEHLAMLRAMPNFDVYRPADLVETIEAWQCALENRTKPAAIVLSRQGLPPVRHQHLHANMTRFGAYILADEDENKPLDIILMTSGSEVHLAMQAAEILRKSGINPRVISVPCLDRLLGNPRNDLKSLLTAGVPRVAIEAGARQSWDRLLNDDDAFIGMADDHGSLFGASAPATELYQHFGITVENIVKTAQDLVG